MPFNTPTLVFKSVVNTSILTLYMQIPLLIYAWKNRQLTYESTVGKNRSFCNESRKYERSKNVSLDLDRSFQEKKTFNRNSTIYYFNSDSPNYRKSEV
jgi:hypothetical protein